MKDKILTLIIGILIGAIITSAGFIIYNKSHNRNKRPDFGTPPQMHQRQNLNQNNGTPKDFPNDEKSNENSTNTQNNNKT